MTDGNRVSPVPSHKRFVDFYARHVWARALVQLIPYAGGSIDTVLVSRATVLGQERFEEFIESVTRRLEHTEAVGVREEFLHSEEFIELFQTTAQTVARSASGAKRERAAAFLAGIVIDAKLEDLSQQVADDLALLRDLHLKIVASLPDNAGFGILDPLHAAAMAGVPERAYRKGFSDLDRLGFVRLQTEQIGYYSGPPAWETTDYLEVFKRAIRDRTEAVGDDARRARSD